MPGTPQRLSFRSRGLCGTRLIGGGRRLGEGPSRCLSCALALALTTVCVCMSPWLRGVEWPASAVSSWHGRAWRPLPATWHVGPSRSTAPPHDDGPRTPALRGGQGPTAAHAGVQGRGGGRGQGRQEGGGHLWAGRERAARGSTLEVSAAPPTQTDHAAQARETYHDEDWLRDKGSMGAER